MTGHDSYTAQVLARAKALDRCEAAAVMLLREDRLSALRTALAAGLAALMALYPSVSAAAMLL